MNHAGLEAFLRLAFLLALIPVPVFAVWKGGAPERWGAGVIVAMTLTQAASMWLHPSRYIAVDPGPLLTDLVGMAGFAVLALEARRVWPIWATSLQLLSLSAHFARWADIAIPPQVYAVMRSAPTFGALVAIFIGTVLHLHRMRRRGFDLSWQNWSRAMGR